MQQTAAKYVTQQDYLAFERSALDKHEYYKGEIFAMSGASFKHNLIESNLRGTLHDFLKDKGCNEFGSNLRIHIPSNTLYTYPDIIILCDDPAFVDDEFDTITNPSVIIEILSPSTANYDRGAKFDLYREITSLHEYLLIDSTAIHAVLYVKNDDNTWTLSETKDLGQSLTIPSINFTVGIAEIYNGVDKVKR
ncbi:Uma2 family endonuclease [Parafilimonas terrae]|jgi:Uma2 family endonuclease|uniref:Endonuclease, Uma2 family (Restriction endonuclease fold) n=1 Tax=Parafilimonas terrae TaxID=1465490 RepID=A0A1I5S402_9BACT|nr:Uma2 family endonuclease [Parafilimonas terrae]SFP65419.1 Endonuclease, Uma2 family (restriction endonuclease fold) [Parafilimonas terrae]